MRSGLWAIALLLSTHREIRITSEAGGVILLVVILFLALDIVEYCKKFYK